MKIARVVVTRKRLAHIRRHRVERHEVLEVFDHQPFIRRGRRGSCYALGRTDAGRYLFVVFRYAQNAAHIVTAREMTSKEGRYFHQHRRRR